MGRGIADCLVLVFTEGVSLRAWANLGMLEREWALYRALGPQYGRLVLVTYGGRDDRAALEPELTPEESSKLTVVSNEDGLSPAEYLRTVPARVRAAVAGCESVVVKTNQMQGGEAAVEITRALRASGCAAGLIARGGYLWTRFVAHEHGPQSAAALSAAQRERALCQAADIVVGTTGDMVDDLAWRYGLEPSRCVVVPNYVLLDVEPRASEDREPGTLLYAGQLSKRKNVDLLVRAVALLPEERRRNVVLEIIGEGDQRGALEKLAKELGAPVRFRSRIPHRELVERMSRCTAYVQSSELEGHPKTVLEAMAAGAPVLVVKAPGLAEVVTHGMNGLRVDADPQALATAIEELLNDAEWRDMLGCSAARTVRNEVGLPRIVEVETEVHKRALAHASRSALRVSA
ncbi:MAG: glycosyltransferase family 4 protein [Planctomycetota bacterium]|nr:glycosyltransferase family 4 protein [Planctomycetota bacterium]